MNIYVGNLSFETTEEDLTEAFKAHGEVESASIIKDRDTGESRGFGFVEMPNKSEALEAIEKLDGTEIKGREIKVNESKGKKGGGGKGGPRGRGGRGGGFGGGGGGRGRGGRSGGSGGSGGGGRGGNYRSSY